MASRGEAFIPDEAVSIRLVRPVGAGLRAYEQMIADDGNGALRCLFRQLLVRPAPEGEDYGLADLLDANDNIVADVLLSRQDFQRIKNKLRCRVERGE